jgi:hypothetical protein
LEIQDTRFVGTLRKRNAAENILGLPQAEVVITIPTVQVY